MRPAPRLLLATTALAFVALVATTTPRAQQITHTDELSSRTSASTCVAGTSPIASVAYWYQAEPHAPFPALPNRDALEIQ